MIPLTSQLKVLESSTNLLATGSSNRTRYQLDVVLETVLISHKVALTDKQLRIIVQRDNKQIQSDPSHWINEQAEFHQVVGLQSTLTLRPNQHLYEKQPAYEPKLYQFIIQALPSQAHVASFELDIALYVNQTRTLTLPPISGLDVHASLELSIRCQAVKSTPVIDAVPLPTNARGSSFATGNNSRSSNTSNQNARNGSFKKDMRGPPMLHRNSSQPGGTIRSSNLTDTSSIVQAPHLDTASEYAEDLAEQNQALTRQVAQLQKIVEKGEASLAAANKKINLLEREIEELKVREAAETATGMQVKAWNLALLQEFEFLKLQQLQISRGAPPSLVDVSLLKRLEALTKSAYEEKPDLVDEPEPELEDSDLDDITSSDDDTDSNINYDPNKEDIADTDVPLITDERTKALVHDLKSLLARNQRLTQDTQLLVYSTCDIPLQDLMPSIVTELSANIDISSQRKENEQLIVQTKYLQAMTAQQSKERVNMERRITELSEGHAMACEELSTWKTLVKSSVVVKPLPPAPVIDTVTQAPTVETAQRKKPSTPSSEATKLIQTLKQENLALKYKNTTLESYQEKYEECEKERKRLEVRLLAQSDADTSRSRGNTLRSGGEESDISEITMQRAAAMDMQINVLSELSRTQAMRIEVMNDEHIKLKQEFAQRIILMKEAVDSLVAAAEREQRPTALVVA